MPIWESDELRATLRMIEAEHLDIRAVTMGISLRDCPTDDLHRTCQRVYDKITRSARRLVDVAREVQGAYGVPITNKRISVTPIALVGEPTRASSYVPLAATLDRAGAELGIDYVAGFSAHVEKGATPGDLVLLDSIPEALATTPAIGDSVAEILEALGLEKTGAPGTTAALALITDAVKKGGVMASSYVGGLSGAFIPVSEDHGMIQAVECGALTLEKLEAMTAVCSVGLDMVAVPGWTTAETLSGIIADEIAIGVVNNKTTAVRIIPVPGKDVGDKVIYGGLLGEAPVMPVSRFRSDGFIRLGGRIPAPIISLRN